MPESKEIISVEIEEEVLAVRLFIMLVEAGRCKFVLLEKYRYNSAARDALEGRKLWFKQNAKYWLKLYQSNRESPEFKKSTDIFYTHILDWRTNNLVEGQLNPIDFMDQLELAMEQIQQLRKELADKIDDNIRLSEQIEEFKRPRIVRKDDVAEFDDTVYSWGVFQLPAHLLTSGAGLLRGVNFG